MREQRYRLAVNPCCFVVMAQLSQCLSEAVTGYDVVREQKDVLSLNSKRLFEVSLTILILHG